MVQRSKTGSGDHARSLGEGTDVSGRRECGGVEGSQGLLQGMVSEVVTLLNEQAFAQGRACTEQEVCESFSQILLRHWNLCCVKFFIRGDDASPSRCGRPSRTRTSRARRRTPSATLWSGRSRVRAVS